MSARSAPPPTLSTQIALRFVADLQAGRRPSIEAALDEAPSDAWSGLLESLLTAELNHRRSRGEVPNLREYLPRFPAHTAIVRAALPEVNAQAKPIVPGIIPTAILVRSTPVAAPAIPVGTLVPSAAIPVAKAYIGPPTEMPLPIVETMAFGDFERSSDRTLARKRRRRKRLRLAAATLCLIVVTASIVGIIKLQGSKAVEPPAAPGPEGPPVAVKNGPPQPVNLFGPKSQEEDREREFAEWVISVGGRGTLVRETGGQLPFNGSLALPKVRFSLTSLVLPPESASQWQAADLERLRGRDKLASISLSHPTALSDASLAPLIGLRLQSLELTGANVAVTGTLLTKFPDLTVLLLMDAPTFSDVDLAAVAKLSKLTSLSINSPMLTSTGSKTLKNQSLRTIHLGNMVKVTPDFIRVLQGLPIENFYCDSQIGDDAFLEFAVMPSIRRFRLRKATITDNGLKAVLGLGKLEELRAIGSSITGPGIEHLAERSGLRILDLSGAKLDTLAIGNLLALPALKELRLAGCPIGNPAVNLLAQLDSLEILDLGETNVSDAALGILKKHGTLKSLILTGTKVTAPAVRDFEQGTPNCKVIFGKRK